MPQDHRFLVVSYILNEVLSLNAQEFRGLKNFTLRDVSVVPEGLRT